MQSLPGIDEMQRAVFARDCTYDGVFFLGVRTTGIFCRPSCAARKPRPENIEYFATARDAIFAGYRACLRCRPMETGGTPAPWAAALVARVEADPSPRLSDRDLRALDLDPARVRRYFLARYGMTFHAYCRGRRMGAALGEIRRGADLDGVGLDHGYESASGFREAFAKTFGVSPGRSRSTHCITLTLVETPLGPMVVGATPDAVCLAEFTSRRMLAGQFDALRKRFEAAMVPGRSDLLDQTRAELAEYFGGTRRVFDVPLSAPGTRFQEDVWAALQRIPYGQTRSYEDLARELGNPGAVRAVGTANGMNRIAILIPCHRVVNKSGALGGYGGGKWRKQALLELEHGAEVRPLL